MSEKLKIAMAGLGRMGAVHARNILQLPQCELVALVDENRDRLNRFAQETGASARHFHSLEDLAASGVCNATMIATPTEMHRKHATTLLKAGHRVLLEKPLTGQLETDREFAAELDREHSNSVMIAFQRRFDAALMYARELMWNGAVGRVFKIYSALEDSGPAPNGYQSDGILPDMSIHNVDEILWLTGKLPKSAMAIGSRIYSHALTTCREDFDDAMLYLWFDDLLAQIQVTRNHVSGYRVESILFGEEGQIQMGRFAQKPEEVVVEAFGKRLGKPLLERKVFAGKPDSADAPEFVARFEPAYKAEVAAFAECCLAGKPFPITYRDALNAQEVITAGMSKMLTVADASSLGGRA